MSDGRDDRAAPGSSGPGEQGYDGAATIGDEGGAAGPESYSDPFGRPDDEDQYMPGSGETPGRT